MPLFLTALAVAFFMVEVPTQSPLGGLDDVQVVVGSSRNATCRVDDAALGRLATDRIRALDVTVTDTRPVARLVVRAQAVVAPDGMCMALLTAQLRFQAEVPVPYQPRSRTHQLPVLLWEATQATPFAAAAAFQSELETGLGRMLGRLERLMR